MTITAKIDTSSALAGLETLRGGLRASLARSMAVAGGEVIRDEAKARATVESGRWQSSFYLAFRDGESTDKQVMYSVSWNSRIAPHGHLQEFGHWQTHQAIKLPNGEWISGERLKSPKWQAANPALRPAFEATKQRAQTAMLDRARVRLPELLAEASE
jgi:HK97 gp10 family phage protein